MRPSSHSDVNLYREDRESGCSKCCSCMRDCFRSIPLGSLVAALMAAVRHAACGATCVRSWADPSCRTLCRLLSPWRSRGGSARAMLSQTRALPWVQSRDTSDTLLRLRWRWMLSCSSLLCVRPERPERSAWVASAAVGDAVSGRRTCWYASRCGAKIDSPQTDCCLCLPSLRLSATSPSHGTSSWS